MFAPQDNASSLRSVSEMFGLCPPRIYLLLSLYLLKLLTAHSDSRMGSETKRRSAAKGTEAEMSEPSPESQPDNDAKEDGEPTSNSETQPQSQLQMRNTSEDENAEQLGTSEAPSRERDDQSNASTIQTTSAQTSAQETSDLRRNATLAQPSQQHQSTEGSSTDPRTPAAGPVASTAAAVPKASVPANQPQEGENAQQMKTTIQTAQKPPRSAEASDDSPAPGPSLKRKPTSSPEPQRPPRPASVPPHRRYQATSNQPSQQASDQNTRPTVRSSAPDLLPNRNATSLSDNTLSTLLTWPSTSTTVPFPTRMQPGAASTLAAAQRAPQTANSAPVAPRPPQHPYRQDNINIRYPTQQFQPQQGVPRPLHTQQHQQPAPPQLQQQQASQQSAHSVRVRTVYTIRTRYNVPNGGHITEEPTVVYLSLAAAEAALMGRIRDSVSMRTCEVRLAQKLLDGTGNVQISGGQAPGRSGRVDAEIVQMAVADGGGDVVWQPRQG